jgi:membrane fusion protein (multidrug efflux system)
VEIDPRPFEDRLGQSRADAQAAQAQALKATGDLHRYEQLFKRDAISHQTLDHAAAEAKAAQAQYEQAQKHVAADELNLSYTKLVAPVNGRITRKSTEPGSYVQVGQELLAVVPDRVWVVANFKETQLTYMLPGQSVTIKIDAYPSVDFTGTVDSIQSGTGSRFSLLPPENATGNFVKVVQRVPVKIVFDPTPDSKYLLAPGMSVEPTVKVR